MCMQTIKYLELPTSFNSKKPMSVQLRNERIKLFPKTTKDKLKDLRNITKYPDIDTPVFPLLKEACDYLDINFALLNLKKATKYTGVNYDLFALVYYFKTRGVYTLVFMQEYIFTERNIRNYSRHVNNLIDKQRYIDLFNYLDSLS